MTEKAFSEKIQRENRHRWIVAVLTGLVAVMLLVGYKLLSCGTWIERYGFSEPIYVLQLTDAFWRDVYVESIIVLVAAGVAWVMRDTQRNDLVIEIRTKSLTQLRRFRGELDDEIQRLEEEALLEENDHASGRNARKRGAA